MAEGLTLHGRLLYFDAGEVPLISRSWHQQRWYILYPNGKSESVSHWRTALRYVRAWWIEKYLTEFLLEAMKDQEEIVYYDEHDDYATRYGVEAYPSDPGEWGVPGLREYGEGDLEAGVYHTARA